MKYIIFFFAVLIACAGSFVLPVEKCNLEDSECMKTQIQKAIPVFMNGIPELGIQVMDVMELEYFSFNLSGLQFSLSGGKFSGMKTVVIDSVKWDVEKKTCQIIYHLNTVLQGRYTASGKVLIMPITGNGDFTMTSKNLVITFDFDYEVEKGPDGKDYIQLKKMRCTYDVKDNANFHLTNLFNGDKELSDEFLKFVNENWKLVTKELGKPTVEFVGQIVFKNMKIFLEKTPINDIANYV